MTIKRIATYGRVSTARQEQEETIKTQMSAVREYADGHKDYTIVQEYVDEGWSGTILARPGLDQLRTDARMKLWDAVLIYDPDRLARRYFYQELVIEELRDLGIETLFVTMPPVVNDEDRLMFGVRGVFAQYERIKIAERFRLGKVRKARDGNIVASEAPYGYSLAVRRGKRGDHNFSETHYEIEDREAANVRLIFRWIAEEKLTLRKVVKRLQQEGIQPRKSKRGVWNTSTLTTLVRNRTYVGEAHYGSSYAVVPENPWKKDTYRKIKKSSRKIRPTSEWIHIKVPAIFETEADKQMFMRAQEQLRENFQLSQRNKKNQYLLAGKIRCECGRSRAGEGPQRGKYLYYRCTGRVHSYPLPPSCTQRGINAVLADQMVWDELYRLVTSPAHLSKQVQAYSRKSNGTLRLAENVVGMHKEIEGLKAQEDRYTKAYGAGLLSVEKLGEYVKPLRQRIGVIETAISNTQSIVNQKEALDLPEMHELEAFAEMHAETLRDLSFSEKQAIVRDAIGSVIGTQKESHGELLVQGSIAIKNYVEYKTSDRHSWAPKRRQVDAF